MRHSFLLILFILFNGLAFSQYTLSEKYEPREIRKDGSKNFIRLPYTKYILNNGVTLLIHEDHSAPLVNVTVTHKVGSVNDNAQLTGCAYLAYKLMDIGSRHLSNGQFARTISYYGGKMISDISKDKTSFSTTGPKNILETILWMEADRQAYLLDSLTPEKFTTIRSEVKQMITDSFYKNQYLFADILAEKYLHPTHHPYSWPVCGKPEHYDQITLTNFKNYFLDWYGSDNTILIVSGDVDLKEVLQLAVKYFGPLTRAKKNAGKIEELVNSITQQENSNIQGPKYISYTMDVKSPMLKICYLTVPRFSNDDALLNTFAQILGQGKNSVLYKELVNKGYAVSVNATYNSYKYSGQFIIEVIANPDTSLVVIKNKVQVILSDISNMLKLLIPASSDGVDLVKTSNSNNSDSTVLPSNNLNPNLRTYDEFENSEFLVKRILSYQNNLLWSMQHLSIKALVLSDIDFYLAKPSIFDNLLKNFQFSDVHVLFNVINRNLINNQPVYLSIVPEKDKNLAAGINNIKDIELQSFPFPVNEEEIIYRYPVVEINKTVPIVKGMPSYKSLPYKTATTVNGLKIIACDDKEYPFIEFQLRMKTAPLSKLTGDLAANEILAGLLTDWFGSSSSPDNALQKLKDIGAAYSFYAEGTDLVLQIRAKSEQSGKAKEAIVRFLYHPDLGYENIVPQFFNICNQRPAAGTERKTNFDQILNLISLTLIDTVKYSDSAEKQRVMKNNCQNALANTFSPQYCSLVAYGDLDSGFLNNLIETMNISPNNLKTAPATTQTKEPDLEKENLYLFDISVPNIKSSKTRIYLNYLTLPADFSPKYFTADFLNYILDKNILTRGMTGINYISDLQSSAFSEGGTVRYFISATVDPGKIDSSILFLENQLSKLQALSFSKTEMTAFKTGFYYKDFTNYEDYHQRANLMYALSGTATGGSYFEKRNKAAKKISLKSIKTISAENIKPGHYLYLVVTDNKKTVSQKLGTIGRQVIEVDKCGTKIQK